MRAQYGGVWPSVWLCAAAALSSFAQAGERGLMLMLNDQTRAELWRRLIEVIESHPTKIDSARVAPELDVEKIRAELAVRDFAEPAAREIVMTQ